MVISKNQFCHNGQKYLISTKDAKALGLIDDSSNVFMVKTCITLENLHLSYYSHRVFNHFLILKMAKDLEMKFIIADGDLFNQGTIELMERHGYVNYLKHDPNVNILHEYNQPVVNTYIERYDVFDQIVNRFKGACTHVIPDKDTHRTFESDISERVFELRTSKDPVIQSFLDINRMSPHHLPIAVGFDNGYRNTK